MFYERTQTSPTWLLAAIPIFTMVAVVAVLAEGETGVVVVTGLSSALIVAVVAHFSRMTVLVGPEAVQITFGTRWPRKTIAYLDVGAVELVRNPWFWGWGIKKIPGGWMWNVWGLDAVELQFVSGKRFRIGTDDPEGLYGALLSFVRRSPRR